MPADIIRDPSSAFVRDVISALSPVNFRRDPTVRTRLLLYLSSLAKDYLGPDHSLTTIFSQLLHDSNNRFLTQCVLTQLHDLLRDQSPLLAVETKRPIIALLRRDGEHGLATKLAIELLVFCKQSFGTGTIAVRNAQKELAHIYMDKCDWINALELCRERVGRAMSRNGEVIGHEYHDSHAIWAMEDLAKIHDETGNLDACCTWLGIAVELSAEIKGRSVGTTHILDKLEDVLRRCGKNDDAEEYRRIYGPCIWTDDMDVTRK